MNRGQKPKAKSQKPKNRKPKAANRELYAGLFQDWKHNLKHLESRLQGRFRHIPVQDIEDAIEAAVWLLFIKHVPLDTEDDIVAWIFVTATYCLENDLHKTERRNRRRASMDEARLLEHEDDAIREFEERDLVDTALAVLSQEDRELLIERYEAGFSLVEIAKERHVPLAKIESRSKRAVKKLRKKLKNLR